MAKKIQGDLDVKNDLKLSAKTASRALELDGSGNVESSAVTSTELGHLSGVTSAIQTQLGTKAADADVIKKDGSVAFTGDQSMGSSKLTNLAAPTAASDAARKADVDAAAGGVKVKDPADLVSTTNITLSGEQTIDGVLTSSSRLLVVGQTTVSENGLYTTAAGAYSRTADFDAAAEVSQGSLVFVLSGTSNADTHYVLNATDAADSTAIDIGTETNEWAIYSRAEAISAGDGIDKSALVISADITNATDKASPVAADEIMIADSAAAGAIKKADLASLSGGIDHDATTNFVANEHIDHTSVTLSAGDGLAGGGDISANRSFDVDITGSTDKAAPVAADEILLADSAAAGAIKKADVASLSASIDHDSTANFAADEHVAHSGVSVVAGGSDGLTVSNDDLSSNIGLAVDIDGTTAETVADDADTILIYDATASALKKMTRANFVGNPGSTGDIAETSFSGADNQVAAANVTSFAFANGTVRSFSAHASVVIDATADSYEEFDIQGIQKGASWEISVQSVGDDTTVVFTITSAGQVQYTSPLSAGFVSLDIKFRAITTSV